MKNNIYYNLDKLTWAENSSWRCYNKSVNDFLINYVKKFK